MKRMRIKFLVVAIGLSMVMAVSSHAITIGVDPVTTDVIVGEVFDVDLTIAGLGNFQPLSLSSYDLSVAFDPSVLSLNNVTFGDQLDLFGFGSYQSWDEDPSGLVNVFEVSFDFPWDLDLLQAGDFVLTTLTFVAQAEGTSTLDAFANYYLGDSFGDPLDWPETIQGTVTVRAAQVPEPSTLLLFGTGLVGIGIFRRKFGS